MIFSAIIWIYKACNLRDISTHLHYGFEHTGVYVAYYVATEGCIFPFDELIKSGFFIFFSVPFQNLGTGCISASSWLLFCYCTPSE